MATAEVLKKLEDCTNQFQVINIQTAQSDSELKELLASLPIGDRSLFLVSQKDEIIHIVCLVNENSEVKTDAWVSYVFDQLTKDFTQATFIENNIITISLSQCQFIDKLRDQIVSLAFGFLRKHKLIKDDEDDDYVLDPEECGIGHW